MGMQFKHAPHLHQELVAKYEGVAFAAKHVEVYTYNNSGRYQISPHIDWYILQYDLYYSCATNTHHSCLFFAKVAAEA